MDRFEFIIALLTVFGTLIGSLTTFFLKYKNFQRRQTDFTLRRQNENHTEIIKTLEILKNENIENSKAIEELKSQTIEFYNIIKNTQFENDLSKTIIKTVNDIIESHSDIDSNMKHLIMQGRDKSIEFALKMRNYLIKIDIDNLTNELSNSFDVLKPICTNYFPEIRKINGIDYNFAKYLRDFTEIKNESKLLSKRIIQNHKTDSEYITMFNDFVLTVCKEGINAYRRFKIL